MIYILNINSSLLMLNIKLNLQILCLLVNIHTKRKHYQQYLYDQTVKKRLRILKLKGILIIFLMGMKRQSKKYQLVIISNVIICFAYS